MPETNPEIGHLDGVAEEQKVLGFDIPVPEGHLVFPEGVLAFVEEVDTLGRVPQVFEELLDADSLLDRLLQLL